MIEDQLIETIENQASMRDLELDDVSIVDDNSDATVVRVLYESGSSETDSVGFQVSQPDSPMGEQQFRRRLRSGLDELKSYVHGDTDTETAPPTDESSASPSDTDSSSKTEPSDAETPSTASSQTQTQTDAKLAQTPVNTDRVTVAVETQLRPEDREAVVTEIADLVDDTASIAELERDVRDLQQTVSELEARIEQYESVFAQLSPAPPTESAVSATESPATADDASTQ